MEYEPNYAGGQILVLFRNSYGKAFARDFGKTLGYELSDETYRHGDAYIFKTGASKEKDALEKFRAYFEFVDWADLRDIKLESRWESLVQAETIIQDLQDTAELPDAQYSQKLDEIIDCLEKLKPAIAG